MNNRLPEKAPEASPMRLVTMTIVHYSNVFINLKVIGRYLPITDKIVGIKFENKIKRGSYYETTPAPTPTPTPTEESSVSNAANASTDQISNKRNVEVNDFKNQCTIVIDVGDKKINLKLFTNGKMVATGCKNLEHADTSFNIVCETLQNIEGAMQYSMTRSLKHPIRKCFNNEIYKYIPFMRQLFKILEVRADFCENEKYSKLEIWEAFNQQLMNEADFHRNVCYAIDVLTLFKNYFDCEDKNGVNALNSAEGTDLLEKIRRYTNFEDNTINGVFPAYINNHLKILMNPINTKIELINHTMDCGYLLNREAICKILEREKICANWEYNKDHYSGVVVKYICKDKGKVTVIFFNTGKININAAVSVEQSEETYNFVRNFCRDFFAELILISEYQNRQKKAIDDLPSIYQMPEQNYILLKKTSILKNPANISLLKSFDLYDDYTR